MSDVLYHYTLPEIPPSNNKFIGRENRWEYQNVKKQWAQLISVCCRPKPARPLDRAEVTLIYHFKDKRRRDPDNYSGKMILDGLTGAGIIADDSFDHIKLCLDAVCDKQGVTEILIKELKECTTKSL